MKPKKLIFMLTFCAIFISCVNLSKAIAKDTEKSEWTVICYLAGDNFLDWFMKENLKELQRAGSSNRVKVITFIDTTDNETKIFEVQKNDLVQIPLRIVNYAWSKSELNTGDPSTLSDFASWAVRTYPAEKYFLILGGYGEGWIGLLHDMNNGEGKVDVLTLGELESSLNNITKSVKDVNGKGQIDVLGLDACYMGMLEVMYQVKDYATYIISSENEERLDGWPYDKLLEPMINDPEISGLQAATYLIDSYIDTARGTPSKMDNVLTLSVVDLRLIDDVVREINNLSAALLQAQKRNLRKMLFVEKVTNRFLINAHIENRYVPYSVLFDLSDFVEKLKITLTRDKMVSASTRRLSKLLSMAVIKERHQALNGKHDLGIGGISLYFAGMDTKSYKEIEFCADTHWDEFITVRALVTQKLGRNK